MEYKKDCVAIHYFTEGSSASESERIFDLQLNQYHLSKIDATADTDCLKSVELRCNVSRGCSFMVLATVHLQNGKLRRTWHLPTMMKVCAHRNDNYPLEVHEKSENTLLLLCFPKLSIPYGQF